MMRAASTNITTSVTSSLEEMLLLLQPEKHDKFTLFCHARNSGKGYGLCSRS